MELIGFKSYAYHCNIPSFYVMYCYNVRVTIKQYANGMKTSRSEVAACVSAFRAFAQEEFH